MKRIILIGCMVLTLVMTEKAKGESVRILTMNHLTPYISNAQVEFVNTHYDYLLTAVLSDELRSRITGPELFLYRSIRGTWTGFNQFDWDHINGIETMFCHNTSDDNSDPKKRIRTIWDSWLMAPDDMVVATDPEALNHWINYYSITASTQVNTYNYDGLFIDSAAHKLGTVTTNGLMPDGYSDTQWRDARYAGLDMIKSYLPDKPVIFNGLHGGNGVEHSLTLTDGGVWEGFAFSAFSGGYSGEVKWREAMELFSRNNENAMLAIISKHLNLTADIQTRMFILSSYLLVHTNNVALYMIDLNFDQLTTVNYYPEYEIEPGSPLGPYTETTNGVFVRPFDKGIVLVNPSASKTITYSLERPYRQVIPTGGGALSETGVSDGVLNYETVSGVITLPPISGFVLLEENVTPLPPVNLKTKVQP